MSPDHRADVHQAWEQLRHIEHIRNQYLGFLFTAYLAAAGVAVPLVAGQDRRELAVVVGQGGLAVLLTITTLAYASLLRIGSQRRHYRNTITLARRQVDPDHEAGPLAAQFRYEAGSPNAAEVQALAEAVVLVLLGGGLAVQLALTGLVLPDPPGGGWVAGSVAATVHSSACLARCAKALVDRRKERFADDLVVVTRHWTPPSGG